MVKVVEHRWQLDSGDYQAARKARLEFGERFLEWCADERARADAELLFGELVSNAVRHAKSKVNVAAVIGEVAVLRVADDGSGFSSDRVKPQPYDAAGGRGLYIATTIARELKVEQIEDQCVVTAVWPAPPHLVG